jgi:hypothetical protein
MRPKTAIPAKKAAARKTIEKTEKKAAELPIEYDRRGKPLPPRARVGGIITPQ